MKVSFIFLFLIAISFLGFFVHGVLVSDDCRLNTKLVSCYDKYGNIILNQSCIEQKEICNEDYFYWLIPMFTFLFLFVVFKVCEDLKEDYD